jgi:hypothetical protein
LNSGPQLDIEETNAKASSGGFMRLNTYNSFSLKRKKKRTAGKEPMKLLKCNVSLSMQVS